LRFIYELWFFLRPWFPMMAESGRKGGSVKRNGIVIGIFLASCMFAGGSGGSGGSGSGSGGTGGSGGGNGGTDGGTGGVTSPNAVEIQTLNETIPAGGTVQFKFLITQPRPIGSSGSRFATNDFDVNGVSIASPLGDAAGAAVWQNGMLDVSVISPSADFGTAEYPLITATLSLPASTKVGTTYPIALADASFVGPQGPLTFNDPKVGKLTVGGSVSIHNVVPGGGTWPAGTIVKVEGTGFLPTTKLTAKMHMSPVVYDGPTQMHFELLDSSTTMDMLGLTAMNPDGLQVTYYSYLRGVPVQPPSRTLLKSTDPIFQMQTHGRAEVGPLPAMSSGQYVALAVQNPTQGPAVVTFLVNGTNTMTTVVLPAGGRVMDEITALLGGVALGANDTVTISATTGVQILGLNCDENAGRVTPFLPVF
jgi:hypothetical protein